MFYLSVLLLFLTCSQDDSNFVSTNINRTFFLFEKESTKEKQIFGPECFRDSACQKGRRAVTWGYSIKGKPLLAGQ
jgi:hypothetical protein